MATSGGADAVQLKENLAQYEAQLHQVRVRRRKGDVLIVSPVPVGGSCTHQ